MACEAMVARTSGATRRRRSLLRADVLDVAADIGNRLRVRVAERLLHPGHVLLGPGREAVVDRPQELERRREADVRDRGGVAADERPAPEEEGVVDLERLG